MTEKNNWQTISSENKYDNPWITVIHNEVITPGGSRGIYGKVSFKNRAVGIIPIDEQMNTWLVGQFRYTLNSYSWEIPEGGCPRGEKLIDAARRELKEETGIEADNFIEILRLHNSNSVTDEEAVIFTARVIAEGEKSPEDTEELQVRKLPFAEVVKMVKRGEITDAMSVAGILRIAHSPSLTDKQE